MVEIGRWRHLHTIASTTTVHTAWSTPKAMSTVRASLVLMLAYTLGRCMGMTTAVFFLSIESTGWILNKEGIHKLSSNNDIHNELF